MLRRSLLARKLRNVSDLSVSQDICLPTFIFDADLLPIALTHILYICEGHHDDDFVIIYTKTEFLTKGQLITCPLELSSCIMFITHEEQQVSV